jgi:hypothetical protein
VPFKVPAFNFSAFGSKKDRRKRGKKGARESQPDGVVEEAANPVFGGEETFDVEA